MLRHDPHQRGDTPGTLMLASTLLSSHVPCLAFELCNHICPYPLSSFSQGYHLQTTRDMRPHPSVTLDPASFHPPPFRSRNQSYMRAVSTLSQASCVSQVSLQQIHRTGETPGDIRESLWSVVLCGGLHRDIQHHIHRCP